MGKFFTIFLALLFCLTTEAALEGTPFRPATDLRFDSIERLVDGTGKAGGIQLADGLVIVGDSSGNANAIAMSGDTTITNAGVIAIGAGKVTEPMIIVQTADGLNVKRVARATLDCGASSCAVGSVSMVQSLPANAIITQAYFHTVTQFVDGGAGTVALNCEDAGNIFAAADITGIVVGTNTSGIPIGTAGTMVDSIAAVCVITATVAVAEQTAGVLNLYLEYVVHD